MPIQPVNAVQIYLLFTSHMKYQGIFAPAFCMLFLCHHLAREYLFYTERKGIRTPMSDDNVRKMLRQYVDSARSRCPSMPPNLHPHHFRHSRAMHLYQHGMDLALVSQWLGHANLDLCSCGHRDETQSD